MYLICLHSAAHAICNVVHYLIAVYYLHRGCHSYWFSALFDYQ